MSNKYMSDIQLYFCIQIYIDKNQIINSSKTDHYGKG